MLGVVVRVAVEPTGVQPFVRKLSPLLPPSPGYGSCVIACSCIVCVVQLRFCAS